MSRKREPYGATAKREEKAKRRAELGLKKGEREINLILGDNVRKTADKDNYKRGFYVSPMEGAYDDAVNSLTTIGDKIQVIGLCDMIAKNCGLWRDGKSSSGLTQNAKSKFVNMINTLKKETFETGKWNQKDYEMACFCLWFLDELKNKNGDSIIESNDDLFDLQVYLLEKCTEGIVDDYINSEKRYNWIMLGKSVVIV